MFVAVRRFDSMRSRTAKWFVEAFVTWEVPRVGDVGGAQGGALMQRVKVEGGETEKVVLSQ